MEQEITQEEFENIISSFFKQHKDEFEHKESILGGDSVSFARQITKSRETYSITNDGNVVFSIVYTPKDIPFFKGIVDDALKNDLKTELNKLEERKKKILSELKRK